MKEKMKILILFFLNITFYLPFCKYWNPLNLRSIKDEFYKKIGKDNIFLYLKNLLILFYYFRILIKDSLNYIFISFLMLQKS